MKNIYIFIITFVFLFASSITHARNNQELCNDWCAQDESCKKCSSIAGCGPGYSPIATFKGFGKNWFACRINAYGKYSKRNEEACNVFCQENELCEKCSEHVGCGIGYQKIMSFSGSGKNWHACRKTMYKKFSEKNKKECNDWCSANELCVTCSTKRECGAHLTSMKHFTGAAGENWHACRKTGSHSNKEACVQWCNQKDNCSSCSKKAGCGMGYKSIKMFKGPGKNWFACEKR